MPQQPEHHPNTQAMQGDDEPGTTTRQTLAGQSRNAEEKRVTALIENTGMPAILCDPDGNLVLINSLASVLLDSRAVPGEKIYHLAVKKEEGEELKGKWRANVNRGKGWSHECRLMGRNGVEVDVQIVAIPAWTVPDEAPSWLVILPDLTEALIQAQELVIYAQELSQLYKSNKTNRRYIQQLEEAQRSREHFYSLVSHELKTPLTSLKAALEMISSPELMLPSASQDVWRLVNSMKRSTDRLERLINDLLDVATAESGGLSLGISPVDMIEVVQTVVDEMAPLIVEKDLSLVGLAGHKGAIVVKGDEIRLKQVVMNLLSNAIKAAPRRGEIRISVTRSARYAKTSFTNPGVVLDASIKYSLFEPFRKSSAGGYKTGAGLGLTVVNALVRAHGGSVAAASGRRQVTFSFTLPLWDKATGQ